MVQERVIASVRAGKKSRGGTRSGMVIPILTQAVYKSAGMRDELPKQERPDVRHLPQTVSFFLKKALPGFTVDSCSEAFLLALRNLIPFEQLHGYLWRPVQQAGNRVRLGIVGNVVSFTEEVYPSGQFHQNETATEIRDDLRVTLHRSTKSLQFEPSIRRILEKQGCRAAIEIYFAYYGRRALWVVLGLPTARQFPPPETQELLLVFCQCALVSFHGAYLAELDERDGKRERPELSDHFDLALRWFHTVVRHLNVGLVKLRDHHTGEAEDALQRASIVAGVCLAELLSLMRVTNQQKSLEKRGDGLVAS